jgi:hypothetical protein
MIEQATLDGQPVTIGYFTRNFEPAEKHKARFCQGLLRGRAKLLNLRPAASR